MSENNIEIDQEFLEEFQHETIEALEIAETYLLKLNQPEDFKENFNMVFRAIHSIKGAAGMFKLEELQKLAHDLESLLDKKRESLQFENDLIDHLLLGIDALKSLTLGESAKFNPEFDCSTQQIVDSIHGSQAAQHVKIQQVKNKLNESSYKVFVVDDETEILEIIEDSFVELGLSVTIFNNSENLLKKIQKMPKSDLPDVIVSDIKMPQMAGTDLLKEVNKIQRINFIFMTAHLTKEMCMECLNHGATHVVEKPFNLVELGTITKRTAELSRRRQIAQELLSFIFYQYSDLKQYLIDSGKTTLCDDLSEQLEDLVVRNREINQKAG